MKLLLDTYLKNPESITATSSADGFPAANLNEWDSGLIWKAASFAADVSIVLDLGSHLSFDAIVINNANFAAATIQANITDEWTNPAYSSEVSLGRYCDIRKAYIQLPGAGLTQRFVRLVVPVQTLDSGSEPFLGNFFVGTASNFAASRYGIKKIRPVDVFRPDSGVPRKKFLLPYHQFDIAITQQSLAETDLFSVFWNKAVLFDELNSDISRMWLVYAPEHEQQGIRNPVDTDRQFQLQEHP